MLEVNLPKYLGPPVCYLSLFSQHVAKCSPCPKSALSSFGGIEVMLTHTVHLHYVLTPICNFTDSLTFRCHPQISTSGTFAELLGHMQNSGNFELRTGHSCSQLRSNKVTLRLLVTALRLEVSVLFVVYLVSHLGHFCSFC